MIIFSLPLKSQYWTFWFWCQFLKLCFDKINIHAIEITFEFSCKWESSLILKSYIFFFFGRFFILHLIYYPASHFHRISNYNSYHVSWVWNCRTATAATKGKALMCSWNQKLHNFSFVFLKLMPDTKAHDWRMETLFSFMPQTKH